MPVTYNKTNWVNEVTPLDADNMNNIENGIESLVNAVNEGGGGSTITIDDSLSNTSTNPVQNKVITLALDKKQDIIQYSVMPEASADLANKIVQYIGNTTTTYTQGLFYKCVDALTKYQWQKISVSSDNSKLNKPDTTSVSAKLVTYSLATGTGTKNVDISIDSGSTDDGIPTSKAVYTEVNKKISAPATVKEGILGYNSVNQISIREISSSGTSVETDVNNIPNNTALKEYVNTKISNITIASVLSDSSTNPVQNKIIKAELDKKLEEPTDNPNNVSVVVYNPSTTETHGYTLDSASLTEGPAGLNKIPTSYAVSQAITKISKTSTVNLVNNAITLNFADALVSTYIITNDVNEPSITFGVTEDFKNEFIGRKIIINYITSLTPSNIRTYSGNGEIKYETEAPTPETSGTLIEATLCKNGTTGTINDFLVYVSYKSI